MSGCRFSVRVERGVSVEGEHLGQPLTTYGQDAFTGYLSRLLMSNEDWFRRTSWTAADEAAFRARNQRSRGTHSKAQYIRIQAETLFSTGEFDLTSSALMLAEECIRDFPGAFDFVQTVDLAGRCCARLGYVPRAVRYFHMALDRQRTFRGVQTLAAFNLGRLVIEHSLTSEYDNVLQALDEYGAPVFPWHAYVDRGVRAAIAHARGDEASAGVLARSALEAASVHDTGLSHGHGALGTVGGADRSTHFYELIAEIAGLQAQ